MFGPRLCSPIAQRSSRDRIFRLKDRGGWSRSRYLSALSTLARGSGAPQPVPTTPELEHRIKDSALPRLDSQDCAVRASAVECPVAPPTQGVVAFLRYSIPDRCDRREASLRARAGCPRCAARQLVGLAYCQGRALHRLEVGARAPLLLGSHTVPGRWPSRCRPRAKADKSIVSPYDMGDKPPCPRHTKGCPTVIHSLSVTRDGNWSAMPICMKKARAALLAFAALWLAHSERSETW